MKDIPDLPTIAIIGGTGKEGKGLAYRWAKAGYRLIIGSRSIEKALAVAQELNDKLYGTAMIQGMDNLQAALTADLVVLTVPYVVHREMLEGLKDTLRGKLLIDVTVPLNPQKASRVQMPPAGSAAQEAHEILGDGSEIAAAFQNISYELLMQENIRISCDVLVTGTSKTARSEALELVHAAGLIGWDAGPIENSVVIEGMTSILIGINKKYGSTHAGIQITGVEREASTLPDS
ncbi:MAG: NADPH-dependent F420 reductase [Anaerolineales bacterium]|nr:NADPH-dependent F420 reductase [Anaerolineales bacterium]